MLTGVKLALQLAVHIAVICLSTLATVDTKSARQVKCGFLYPVIVNPHRCTKMDAEPELAAQAATPGVEQDSQAGANQSRLRETIESIKQSASANQSEEAKKERKKEATEWLVVLYNDDVHSFAYVTETLAKVVPLLSREVAYTIATEAHNTGEAAVVRTWKAKAEAYCTELQKHGLTVCAVHDSYNKQLL